MSRARGFVLMTTVLMIAMLALLIISSMKAVWLYVKTSHQMVRNHEVAQKMEGVASQIDVTHSPCVAHDKTPNQLLEWLSTHQGCAVYDHGYEYHYLVGELGDFPCLRIIRDSVEYSSHHWLLTVASPDLKGVFLQIRMALPITKRACESELMRVIPAGILSWRKVMMFAESR